MCLCGVGGGVGGNVRAARHGLINRARTSHAWGYLGMGPGMLERRDVRAYKSRPYIPALQQCAPIYSQPCRVASTAACVRSHLHFLHDVVHVRLRRFEADGELLGDGAIGQARDYEAQHLVLAIGQELDGADQSETRPDACASIGIALDLHASSCLLDTLAHRAQAETQWTGLRRPLHGNKTDRLWLEPYAVIMHLYDEGVGCLAYENIGVRGLCVFAHIGQRLLDKAKDGGFQRARQFIWLIHVESDRQTRLIDLVIVEQIVQSHDKVLLLQLRWQEG